MKKNVPYKLRLYVTGDSPNSTQAIANLNAICRDYMPGRHEIEIVDVLCRPKQALADGILLTPTLVKLSPAPMRKVIGNLSQLKPVLLILGLAE